MSDERFPFLYRMTWTFPHGIDPVTRLGSCRVTCVCPVDDAIGRAEGSAFLAKPLLRLIQASPHVHQCMAEVTLTRQQIAVILKACPWNGYPGQFAAPKTLWKGDG